MNKAIPSAVALAALALAGPALAAPLDSSSADAASAQFVTDATRATLPPVAPVAGSAPPAYDRRASLPSFRTVLHIGGSPVVPSFGPALYIGLGPLSDHAAGTGIGIDNYSAEGDAKVTNANLSLNLDPLPPTDVVPAPPLQISAASVAATASFDVVVPRPGRATGSASVSSLVVSGSLVGGRTLTYSGTPPANHVLFSSPEVEITLNRQLVVVADDVCTVKYGCTVIPGGISVEAVHVDLHKAPVFGRPVTGSFSLGEASAR